MAAIDDLNALLASLPGFALLSNSMKLAALENAVVPDSTGLWPGQPGYTATYDPYWAALGLIGFLQAQPVIRQSSSEGTSVAVDAPQWDTLIAYYKGQSKIAQATQAGPILNEITIPGVPHVRRVDMRHGGGDYDDVDTDAR